GTSDSDLHLSKAQPVRYCDALRTAVPDKMKRLIYVFLAVILVAAPAAGQQTLDAMIDHEIAQLVSTYKMLHAAPELSHYEIKTSAFVATQLREFGYTVTENVGK